MGGTCTCCSRIPSWLALANEPQLRHQRWRDFVLQGIDDEAPDPIRLSLRRQHPYGNDRFRTAIEVQLGRRCGKATIGRPKKQRPE